MHVYLLYVAYYHATSWNYYFFMESFNIYNAIDLRFIGPLFNGFQYNELNFQGDNPHPDTKYIFVSVKK